MKGNFVAKNMNAVNRSSVHKDLRKEFLEDHKAHIEEGLRGCTANSIYLDDSWYNPVMTPMGVQEDCSELTEEQLKDFEQFFKNFTTKHPVKFFTATHIDRKET